jgi:chromosome partitioning protein
MIQIAFINGKGGVGKTTCAMLIAAALKNAGQSVALDDRDPQKSATTLANLFGLPLGKKAEVVIIDTPPNVEASGTLDAIKTAHIVVLVATPIPIDLATTATTAEIVKKLRTGPTRVLFNNVTTTNRFFEFMPSIAKQLPFPVFKNFLARRTSYQVTQMEGWKAMPPAHREEVINIASEIALAISK